MPMKRVAVIPFPSIENAYILISGQWREDREHVRANMSFLYDNGTTAAEWEPQYGPIQLWTKAKQGEEKTREHYFYDYVIDECLNWSQLAVKKEDLERFFVDGDYEMIFMVLKRWAGYEREDD